MRFTHSFLNFCGEQLGSSILPALPAELGHALALVDEIFDPACAVTQRPIAHADDRKEGMLRGGMIPNPVFGHVEAFCNVFRGQQRIMLRQSDLSGDR